MGAPARRSGLPPFPAPSGPVPPVVRLPYPLPLDFAHLQRVERLVRRLGARYRGWAREARTGLFAVDVLERGEETSCTRFTGETLYAALGAALDATTELTIEEPTE